MNFKYITGKPPKNSVAIDTTKGILSPDEMEKSFFIFSIASPKYTEEYAIKRYKTRLFNLYKNGTLDSLVQEIKNKDIIYLITESGIQTEFSKHVEDFVNYLKEKAPE